MATDPIPDDDTVFDDEAHALEMREYWSWAATQPDSVEYLAAMAEECDIERMEEEGIAAAGRNGIR